MMKTLKRDIIISIVLFIIIIAIMTYIFKKTNIKQLFSITLLLSFLTLLYPVIKIRLQYEKKRHEIDSNIHLFITNLALLSTTEIDRREIFRILSEKKEFGEIANESRRIYLLTSKWYQNLATAARILMKRTPSKLFSNFLERMAYAIDSGEDLKEFMKRERNVSLNEFSLNYKGMLYDLEIIRDIFIAISIALTFLIVFAMIIAILVGFDIVRLLLVAGIFFITIELIIFYLIKLRSPIDPIWIKFKETYLYKNLFKYILITISLILIFIILIKYKLNFIPIYFKISFITLPLLIIGYKIFREERKIISRDEYFPQFISSLGTSLATRGGGLVESLKFLQTQNFGLLTENIRRLFKRVYTRISLKLSWMVFGKETCSFLIKTFSSMFSEAYELGGDPKFTGESIAKTFRKILDLRKTKFQHVKTYLGVILGVSAAISFAIALSFLVSVYVSGLLGNIAREASDVFKEILHVISPESIKKANLILFSIILIHNFISSLSIKIIDGGNKLIALLYFPILNLISASSFYVADLLLEKALYIEEAFTEYVERAIPEI